MAASRPPARPPSRVRVRNPSINSAPLSRSVLCTTLFLSSSLRPWLRFRRRHPYNHSLLLLSLFPSLSPFENSKLFFPGSFCLSPPPPFAQSHPCLGIFFSCLGQASSSISSAPSSSSPSEASLCFSAFLLLLLIPAKSLPPFLSSPSGNLFFPASQLTVLGSKSGRGGKGKRNVAPSSISFPHFFRLAQKDQFFYTQLFPLCVPVCILSLLSGSKGQGKK